jgi:hypothetical protein
VKYLERSIEFTVLKNVVYGPTYKSIKFDYVLPLCAIDCKSLF